MNTRPDARFRIAILLAITANIGVVVRSWFSERAQHRSDQLRLAGDNVQWLAMFTASTAALTVFVGRLHHEIKANSHG